MSDVAWRRLAWGVFAFNVLFLIGAILLGLRTPTAGGAPRSGGDLVFGLLTLPFPIVGIAILARQPRNAVGWVLLVIGLAWAASSLAIYGDWARAHGLPGGSLAIVLSFGMWAPPIGLLGTVLLLRFPGGRLLSPRWRWVERVALATLVAIVALIDLSPGNLAEAGYEGLRNPIGIPGFDRLQSATLGMFLLVFTLSIAASAAGLVLRFRRSRGVERLQMKWLASAAAIVAVIFLVAMVASLAIPAGQPEPLWSSVLNVMSAFSFLLIPVAIGFAVLRYRLYDIDRLVNRTLVYLVLTIVLGLVYVVVALVPVLVVGAGQDTPPVVVAAGTLAVAALFGPTRRRVQSFIDRRFYRRRYDAQRTLAAFAAGLKQEVDLDALRGRLLRAVDDTVQPAEASVWLRPEALR